MASLSRDRKIAIRSALAVSLASAAGTLAVLGIVYALRGVWPFGGDNVAYVDTAQFYVPGYYRLWDVLHGRAAMQNSWYAGLAEGLSASWKTVLSPASWVFLLVSRDHILEGLSLYLAAKLAIVALAAGLALSLRFPGAPRRNVLWAMAYTFCGFTLQYYANFSWLDAAAAFPLLLCGLERLLRRGRCGLYIGCYVFFLYLSVYYAYMATLYILLFSLGYILLLLPREQRGDRAFRLGLATAAALGIGACFFVSSSTGLASTSRFESNMDSGLLDGMLTWDTANIRHTVLMLLGMSPAAAVLLRARRSAGKSARRFALWMAAVFAVPMVFTNVDTVWHFGQYNFFPMRYGYMLPATAIGLAAAALEKGLPPVKDRSRALDWARAIFFAAALLLLLPKLTALYQQYGSVFLTALGRAGLLRWLVMFALAGVAFTALYGLLLRADGRRAAWAMAGLMVLQMGVNALGFIAPEDGHTYTNEYDPSYIETADGLYGYFQDLDLSPLSRVKNADSSLNAGYAPIAGVSALSSVDSTASATRLGVFRQLGYTVNYFRTLDVGGTVFTDMLLGVDRALTALPPDEDLYRPGDTAAGMYISDCLYPGVIGLQYPAGALDGYFDCEDLAQRLNCLYRAFTGSGETAAADLSPAELAVSGQGLRAYRFTCTLDAPAFLYLAADGAVMNIAVDGEPVAVPSYLNLENTVYPAAFNAGLLCLGLAPAGDVTVSFSSALELAAEDIHVTAVDQAAMAAFPADARRDPDMTLQAGEAELTVTVTADEEGMALFLPMTCNMWRCQVNGAETELLRPLDTLIGVPLEKGENTIRLWRPARWVAPKRGLAVSAAALALCLAWHILRRRLCPAGRELPSWAGKTALGLFCAAAAACILFVYAAPLALLIARGTVIWP